jgi:hypothetical protein
VLSGRILDRVRPALPNPLELGEHAHHLNRFRRWLANR